MNKSGKKNQISKHARYSTIVLVLLIIMGIYALYKLYKLYSYIRERFYPSRDMRVLTAPLGEIQTFTRTDGTGNKVNILIKISNESIASHAEAIALRTFEHVTNLGETGELRRSRRVRSTKSYF
jgi:hypothetical protein